MLSDTNGRKLSLLPSGIKKVEAFSAGSFKRL
jgi:hypothetical protein